MGTRGRRSRYGYICLIDHVLGVDPRVHPQWGAGFPESANRQPYTIADPFHESMVTMGFFAGITGLGLSTAILVIPQRQTALVAKQAVEVDILSGGRLRLGLAVGWNPIEYACLGQDFHRRGDRLDEQISLLRRFWSDETVSLDGGSTGSKAQGSRLCLFRGRFPCGWADTPERVLPRVGELADGWIGGGDPDRVRKSMGTIWRYAAENGRDPDAIGFEALLGTGYGQSIEDVPKRAAAWTELATHFTVDTMGAGLKGAEHIDAMERIAGLCRHEI